MKYNSSHNYNIKKNYNNVSRARIFVLSYYDPIGFIENNSFQFIHPVNVIEDPFIFSDSPRFRVFYSDFNIGTFSGLDGAADWFSPLEMKVDWANTSLQVMPTSESEYIDMPNVDGSMVQNTTYKNRAFNFVLYSVDGLSSGEKYDLKQKIVKVLDGTKGGFKKLSIPPNEHYFEVKYSGSASIQDGPSFIKATVPFEVKPYNHPMFPDTEVSSGKILNSGLKDCGLRVEITGPVSSPSFTVKYVETTKEFKWSGSLSESEKLVIDGESMVCYKVSSDGTKTNAITNLSPTGKDAFVTIHPGDSIDVSPSENTKNHATFSINESFIW